MPKYNYTVLGSTFALSKLKKKWFVAREPILLMIILFFLHFNDVSTFYTLLSLLFLMIVWLYD